MTILRPSDFRVVRQSTEPTVRVLLHNGIGNPLARDFALDLTSSADIAGVRPIDECYDSIMRAKIMTTLANTDNYLTYMARVNVPMSCTHCNELWDCSCLLCEHCDSLIEPDTGCDACLACAECVSEHWECTQCAEHFLDQSRTEQCPECDYCEHCCDCVHCQGCGALATHTHGVCGDCYRCYDACCSCWYCESCSESHPEHVQGCGECNSCLDACTCSDDEIIKDYGTEAPKYLGFQGSPADGLFLGVELEVEVHAGHREDSAESWLEHNGEWSICCEDGSLNQAPGYEIKTAPMSLELHQQRWAGALAREAWANKVKSCNTTTCGLHVHVSRAPLSPLTIGKIVCFMNSDASVPFVVALAGRKKFYNGDYDKGKAVKSTAALEKSATEFPRTRYEAVNLCNADTIEFRVFKGTVNTTHVLADIEFCEALVRWSIQNTVQECDSVPAFVAWVRERADIYSNLLAYIAKRSIKCA